MPASMPGCIIILILDHLDYTKGIPLWVQAFDDVIWHYLLQEQQLQDDIFLLIKASGLQPCVLYANTTPLEMLENYTESTGNVTMSPGDTNI